ncbi:MAG: exosortase E/protease, VPEID-CTERM system [Candidatus Competibacteraceae bacterium]
MFANARIVLGVGILALAFSLALLGARLKILLPDLGEQASRQHWWPWLVFHLVAFAAFFESTRLISIAPDGATRLSAVQLLGWGLLGVLMFACWLLAFASAHRWLQILYQAHFRLLSAVAISLAIWVAAPLARQLWPSLADGTLWFSYYIISLFYSNIIIEPQAKILGTTAFQIRIDPACSGYEGLVLMLCFLGIYLWLFRKNLHFPKALLLLPIGMLTIWIANGLRISALIAIGTVYSAEVAVHGFHSQAGWIAFTAVALGLVAITHRARFFTVLQPEQGSMRGIQDVAVIDGAAGETDDPALSSRLATALLFPFMALLATILLTQAFSSGFDYLYPLRVVVTVLVLWYFRKAYRGLGWTWSWQALGIGVLVFLLWIALTPNRATDADPVAQGLAGLAPWLAATWLVFRVLGSVITVPLAEELVFRGYLLRKLIARDFARVHPCQLTWLSFLGSSLVFGLLHSSWLAGTLAGMGYALAYYRRGQLGDAVAAHMSTNALIVIWVFAWKDGSLWMG